MLTPQGEAGRSWGNLGEAGEKLEEAGGSWEKLREAGEKLGESGEKLRESRGSWEKLGEARLYTRPLESSTTLSTKSQG